MGTNLRLGVSLFIYNFSWANSRWAKLFASPKGKKEHGAKITLYTVVYNLHVAISLRNNLEEKGFLYQFINFIKEEDRIVDSNQS